MPTKGRTLSNGHKVTGTGLDRGIVFQQHARFPWKSVRGNMEFGLAAKGKKPVLSSLGATTILQGVYIDKFIEQTSNGFVIQKEEQERLDCSC